MRKIFLSVVGLVVLWSLFSSTCLAAVTPSAAPTPLLRYMTCDLCGLCPDLITDPLKCTITGSDPSTGNPINLYPGDWQKCANCLYSSAYFTTPANVVDAPAIPDCKTLLMKDDNTPLYPATPGTAYTMVGCISSATGFTSTTGAPTFVQVLLNVIFSLSGGIAFLYLMYGGYIILTSQADPERLNYGRRLIYGAIAGLIITVSSVFIVNLIGSGILHIPGFTTP